MFPVIRTPAPPPAVTGASPLRLEGIAKTYPGAVPVPALRPFSCTIDPGESVAVVGPSGSGKSTLLNLLGLLDRPTAGAYRIGDVSTADLGDRARTALRATTFGFVFQAFHLLDDRDVVRNVELGMLYGPTPPTERQRRAAAAVDRVGLSGRSAARPATLSGGERQRVAIARAIASRPRVLLCDEPSGNLDSANAESVLDLLLDLNDEGVTLVVVTHDLDVAARMRRRLTVRDGVVTDDLRSAGQAGQASEASQAAQAAQVLDPTW
jgi:putative ABC transport system ATP-binding protein